MVIGGHVEVARLGRVMRGLFGNIVCARAIRQVPVTRVHLAKNRVQGLFHTTCPLVVSDSPRSVEEDLWQEAENWRAYGGLMCQPLR